jgi:DNA-binding transcriptional MocR family regulator
MGADGRLDPSHATLAARARVSIATVIRALTQLRAFGFVTWVRRLVRTAWRAEQTSSAYVLALPAPPAPFSKAIFLKRNMKTTARSFCKSQAKGPSAIDVVAARDALERRRRVMEGRLMSGRTGASS